METSEYDLMDAAEAGMWWYRALHIRLLRALEPVRGTVLDAGCGTGGFLERLGAERPDLQRVGVDLFPRAAARAAAKSGAVTACSSIQALPFPDAAFDAVLSADVLCHKSLQPGVALREFARVLKPGGRLVLNLPAYDWLTSAHDVRVHTARRFTAKGVLGLLADAGFEGRHAGYWNSLPLPLMIMERKLIARDPTAPSDVKPFPPLVDSMLFAATTTLSPPCIDRSSSASSSPIVAQPRS